VELLNGDEFPVVDAHCHPCPETYPETWADFCRSFSLSVPRPGRKAPAGAGLVEEQMLLEMARLFGCEPEPDAVMAERRERAADLVAYTRWLMQDAGIRGMVVDFGYPQPPLSPNYWREMTGVPVGEIFRIEPLIQRLLGECSDFASFRVRYLEGVAGALSRPDCKGLKSIIAYRTGLGVHPAGEQQAEQSFAVRDGEPVSLKPLRDWCLLQAMELCRLYRKPMTIHTGAGDSEIKLETARPELLYDILTKDPYAEVPVVLVHAGYPWCRQAAFMARVLENVYLDTSLLSPFSGYGGVKLLLEEVLHTATVEKVMHGSDCFAVPEVAWLGAILTRRALVELFQELVDRGFVREAFARFAIRSVLMENAQKLFAM